MALAIAGGLAWLSWRQLQAVGGTIGGGGILAASDVFLPSAGAWRAHWAGLAGGSPSMDLGADAAAGVQPTVVYMAGPPGRRLPASPHIWTAPARGTGPGLVPSDPGGRPVLPGPLPPGSPTPQSAVESSSPFLPADLSFLMPLAANRWYFGLSAVDPRLSVAAGSGGMVDVKRIPITAVLPDLGV
jgi:hypothetical protein